jgi:DUF971 family protein
MGVTADGGAFRILWADGHETRIPLVALRRACPCATCQHERHERAGALAPVSETKPKGLSPLNVVRGPSIADLAIASTAPIGRYAVQLVWRDGHSTGIYPYDLLRSLCPCGQCTDRPGGVSG